MEAGIFVQLVVLRVDNSVVFTIENNAGKSVVYKSGHMDNDLPMHDVTTLNSYLRPGNNTLRWRLDNDPDHGHDGDAWHLSFLVVANRLERRDDGDLVLEKREKHGNGGTVAVWEDSLVITG